MLTAPRFIFFDVGNVLVHYSHQRSRDQIARVVGIEPRQVQALVFEGGLQDRYESGQINCQQFADEILSHAGSTAAPDDVIAAASRIFELNRELVPLLTALRMANLPLGILSNTCPGHWREVLRTAPLIEQYFRCFVLSHESKSMKPDPGIYQEAIRQAGEPPGRVFFVDDRPENIEAARLAGLDAHLFESAERLWEVLEARGIRLNG